MHMYAYVLPSHLHFTDGAQCDDCSTIGDESYRMHKAEEGLVADRRTVQLSQKGCATDGATVLRKYCHVSYGLDLRENGPQDTGCCQL